MERSTALPPTPASGFSRPRLRCSHWICAIDILRLSLIVAVVAALTVAFASLWRGEGLRRAYAAERARLDALLRWTPDAIVWCDASLRVLRWNDTATQTFGEALRTGVTFTSLVQDSAQEDAGDSLVQFAAGEAPSVVLNAEQPAAANRTPGELARLVITGVRVRATREIAFIVRDVTLATATGYERTRVQRMDAIGQLAHGIAHDFNNLLTTITGRAEMALQHVRTGVPGRADIEEIRHAAARAAALARRLLALSRDQALQPRIVAANELVHGIEPTLKHLAGLTTLTITLDPDAGSINADPARLQETLVVIAQHALDSLGGHGGRLLVRTRRSREALRGKSGVTDAGSDYTVIEVADGESRPGTDARAHVLEPYFATTGARPGTGLELASAYAFARESGGTVEMQNVQGSGTTIRLVLPRVSDDAAVPREGRLKPLEEPHRQTVLVVEDEESVRLFVRVVLEKQGYRVLQAANGVEALRLLDDPNVTVDVLLTDVMMPLMGGGELAERMLSVQPDVRVIFMSGYVADLSLLTGVAERRAPLLQKPFSLDEMVRVVRESIEEPSKR